MLRNVASNVSIIQPNQFTIITSALVHINEPALVELTDDSGVRLRHSLVLSAQQDALDLFEDYIIILICQKQNQTSNNLNLIPNVAYVPAVRAGVRVLNNDHLSVL